MGVLADRAGRVGPDRVEVAEQDRLHPTAGGDVADDLLAHVLRPPVGALGAGRRILGDRNDRRLPVDGARRGEHQPPHPRVGHHLQQRDGRAQVVVVVRERLLDRLPHRLVGREVDHLVDTVDVECPSHGVAVPQVRLHRDQVGGGQRAERLDHPGRRVGVVVDDHDVASGVVQRHCGVGADVARSPGHEHCHVSLPRCPRTGSWLPRRVGPRSPPRRRRSPTVP